MNAYKTIMKCLTLTLIFAFIGGCKDNDFSKYEGTWKSVDGRLEKTLVLKEEGGKLRATETIDKYGKGKGWDVDLYLTAQADNVLVETSGGETIPKLEMQKDGTLLSHFRSIDATFKKVN
jgi:hypothetical protein